MRWDSAKSERLKRERGVSQAGNTRGWLTKVNSYEKDKTE
jgi:hypothetical protein